VCSVDELGDGEIRMAVQISIRRVRDTAVTPSASVGQAQWRQREFKVGGTSLVSRLSACLTEANWWRLIAE